MAPSVGGMIVRQTLIDLWKSRFRGKDLRIIVPLGVVYGLIPPALLHVLRQWFAFPDSSGVVGQNFFANVPLVVFTTVAGILLVWLFALWQVNEDGIPHGLTPQAALKPVAFMAVVGLISTLRLVEEYGYGYAAALILIICLNTLWVSSLMRWYRLRQ